MGRAAFLHPAFQDIQIRNMILKHKFGHVSGPQSIRYFGTLIVVTFLMILNKLVKVISCICSAIKIINFRMFMLVGMIAREVEQ